LARVTVVWRRELGVLAVNWSDILDGEIVNAAWAVAGMVAKPRTARKVAASLDIAAWADTKRLIRDALREITADPELPELSADDAAGLTAAVRGPEVQGALQALLAVRLTDAPETDAARAREAVRLALAAGPEPTSGGAPRDRRGRTAVQIRPDKPAPASRVDLGNVGHAEMVASVDRLYALPAAEPTNARYAARLSEYFDDKISALVATLEGRIGYAGLAQVRAEAYNARIVALLGAIERQVAALADPGRGAQAEAQFLNRYRRQAHLRHGFLTPPDFDRRRRVPVADIYVPTWISEEEDPERTRQSPDPEPGSLKVRDLAGLLDRTVLLGDPGGGKTTAANVLTDRFADDGSPRVAFLVTLREYAAKTPIEWSVAEHIEHNLKTLYQCPSPDGLVERLLLTGRAVVIFDGLDELLDTSRRREVSDRVEQFCSAFPLAPVLVTSRAVGYGQARLDDSQFTCYRLGGFGYREVAEYAGKWFGTQEGLAPAEAAAKAAAFLDESAHATDLRTSPLLLSLMCILYRGAGSLPGDRAGIYTRCAELMLRKWDEQRDLYRKLGSDHLVEPTLRYLAWWLFTRENSQTAATEQELIAKGAGFLYERGYDTEEQARAAAREFVEFCRGRMWVFSDAGTSAGGERLYGFTHRTFLEYFAAWHLAVTSESPEDLARTLAPRIAAREWSTVAELAIRMKSDMSDRGSDRVYAALLDPGIAGAGTEPLLEFLAVLLPSARPAPTTARNLTRAVLDHALRIAPRIYADFGPMEKLFASGGDYLGPIGEEISGRIASLVSSGDAQGRADGLWLVSSMPLRGDERDGFWKTWAQEQCRHYATEIAAAAIDDTDFRALALCASALTIRDAVAMPGGLTALVTASPDWLLIQELEVEVARIHNFDSLTELLLTPELHVEQVREITAIGEYLIAHPEPPWVSAPIGTRKLSSSIASLLDLTTSLPTLDEDGNVGVAALLCIGIELAGPVAKKLAGPSVLELERGTRSEPSLLWYIARRLTGEAYVTGELPDLAVPAEFRQLFRDWAGQRVDFVEFTGGEPAGSGETRRRSG
jgi:hypothetical protein